MPIKPAKPVDQAGAKNHAAGTIFVEPEGHILLLLRSSKEGNYAGHWGLPGGGVDAGETPESAATREAREEMGDQAPTGRKRLLDQRRTPNNWIFHTFAQACDNRFVPVLNEEHTGYAWAKLGMLPSPIHPSIEATLKECRVKDGAELHEWAGEHVLVEDNEMAMDEAFTFLAAEALEQLGPRLAFDRAPDGVELDRPGLVVTLAFDREPDEQNQVVDGFERLHVKRVPITKACVNPYYGREIPKGRELGLEPDKVYRLLRDPKEIEKGASTSHNVPLLSKHVPHSADQHDGDITVGTVGSEAEYEHPYLYNSLAVWSRAGRDYAEGDQKELSSAYAYDADMTPGEFEGEPYDGVMRNLKWNHVCLVKKGRAGSDIALDEELKPLPTETSQMAKTNLKTLRAGVALGILTGALRGVKLAQDAAIDLRPVVKGVSAKGKFKDGKPTLVAGMKTALKGKLAQDSDLAAIIENVSNLIDAVDGNGGGTDIVDDEKMDDGEIEQENPDGGEVAPEGGNEAIAAYLKSKGVPDDVIAGMPGGSEKVAGDKDAVDDKDKEDDKEKPFDKGAMDAAIAKAQTDTIARMNAVQAARDHVFPVAGKLEMAFDSAEGVYHQAFKLQGKDMSKVKDVSALQQMWNALPVPGARPAREAVIAQDAESVDAFAKQFPNMAKVKRA
jgi:8-oxo-dGTP pyrophosphatase MutT (NUDIX family)